MPFAKSPKNGSAELRYNGNCLPSSVNGGVVHSHALYASRYQDHAYYSGLSTLFAVGVALGILFSILMDIPIRRVEAK